MRPGHGHYIRRNESSRIPRRHIIFDTEAQFTYSHGVQLQSWRCGVADFAEWTDEGRWRLTRHAYTDVEKFWADVDAFTRPKKRTVLWAHNVSYDLRVADTLANLERRDWDLTDIRLQSRGTWATWHRSGRSLAAVDSGSVWPCSLETLGSAMGMGKLRLPVGDDIGEWLARCDRDVEILSAAVLVYLDWLRSEDMGTWQMTGAGQAWGAWRHRHLTHKVLVSDDLDARAAERRAMWTGRTEAWTYGTDETAMVYDYDFERAYASIAATTDLPVKQYSTSRKVSLTHLLKWTERFCVLADVEVTTETPVVPTELDGRIVWPVGTFTTTLWDPELRLLHEAEAKVTVGRVWLYRKAPVLRQWAEWILALLDSPDSEVPAWLKIILKHWSRALIGRFAMRYKSWEEFATADSPDLRVIDGRNRDTDEPMRLLQVGTRVLGQSEESEARDSAPFVTGYVMSEARARLWHAVQVIGPKNVHYMDTDSLLVTAKGHLVAQEHASDPALAGLRVKRRFRGYSIAGPRQLIVGGEPRIAGVPTSAERTGEWRFEGHVWRSLGESIRLGEPDQVRVTARTFRVMQVDKRRTRGPGNRTEPIRLPREA